MYDTIVIGGGIVGTAILHALARFGGSLVLLEKECELCFGVSKSNSGIIHTGFQSDPDTLKARLAVRGNVLYRDLSANLEFPFLPCGELVVAFAGEESRLEKIRKNGEQLGVPGMKLVDRSWLNRNEPNLSPDITAALLAPGAGVINPYEAVYAMAENAVANGAEVHCDTEVTAIFRETDCWLVECDERQYRARTVINAAGLFADEIAALAGISLPQIHPRKGEEFLLDRHEGHYSSRIIFPLPTKVSKGVLVIPTVDGNTMIGPTAENIADKRDLATSEEGKIQVLETVKKIMPKVNYSSIIASFAGLRPVSTNGDFYIHEDVPGFVNVAGIHSPGLTAAPAIAELVLELLAEERLLTPKAGYIAHRSAIPRVRTLGPAERNALIAADLEYGEIVCRCEQVTRGEIREAVRRGAKTLDGIKFRTRSQMGRCHGSFCTMKIAAILAEELGIGYDKVTKRGGESFMATGSDTYGTV